MEPRDMGVARTLHLRDGFHVVGRDSKRGRRARVWKEARSSRLRLAWRRWISLENLDQMGDVGCDL